MSRVSMSLMHSMLNDDQGTTTLKLSSSFIDGNGALILGGFRPSFGNGGMDRSLVNVSAIGPGSLHDDSHVSYHALPIDGINDDDSKDQMQFDDVGWQNDEFEGPNMVGLDKGDMQTNTPMRPSLTISVAPTAAANSLAVVDIRTKQSLSGGLTYQRSFALLDPHIVVSGSRPARRGRPYQIPSELQVPLVSSNIQNLEKKRDSWQDFITGNIPTSGLTDMCLLPLLKLKRKLHRKRLQQARDQGNEQFIADQSMHRTMWEEPQALLDNVDNKYQSGTIQQQFEVDANDLPDDVDYNVGAMHDTNETYGVGFEAVENRYPSTLSTCDAEFMEEEELARRVDAALNSDLQFSTGHPYELICKQYIEGFHRGANAFAK
jgi:hypothetical protein